jgi:hypothetical protein
MLFIIACTKQTSSPVISNQSIIITSPKPPNNIILEKFTNIVWTLRNYTVNTDIGLEPYKGSSNTYLFRKNHVKEFYCCGSTHMQTWQVLNDSTIATLDTTCLNYSNIYCADKTYISMPNDTNLYLWTYDYPTMKKYLYHYTGKY